MILDVLIEARLAGRLDLTRPEHPAFTYDTAYARDGDGPTPGGIAATLRSVEIPGRTRMVEAFRDMLAFQWLIVGNDAHAKNYGLLLRGRGRYLAPLYDACSWMPYRLPAEKIGALRTAMKIGRDHRISSADQPTAMLHTADRLGLPADDLAARFGELASLLPDALDKTVASLPPAMAELPIVVGCLIDQHRRAGRCEAIAERGRHAALARRATLVTLLHQAGGRTTRSEYVGLHDGD